jgi:addiction module RelE/StbE family toxin
MIDWSDSAVADFETILEYISRDNHEMAINIGLRIRSAIMRLKEYPLIGKPGRRSGTRELNLPGPPFVVVYTTDGERIQIARILHAGMLWPR